MKRLILPTLALLGGCDGTPLAPDRQPAFKTSSTVTVFARTQDVTLLFSSGETVPASFKARFYAGTSPDPEAQIDGAILVVSAADGPMPQIGGESLEIEIFRATINRAGVVQFEGTATVITGREVSDQFPIAGSARPSNGDPIIREIPGGKVYDFEVEFGAQGIGVIEVKEVWVTFSQVDS